MPRYFFNTIDGQRYPDEEGAELAGMPAVKARATKVIGEMLKERAEDFWDTGKLRLEVTNEAGEVVLALEVALRTDLAA